MKEIAKTYTNNKNNFSKCASCNKKMVFRSNDTTTTKFSPFASRILDCINCKKNYPLPKSGTVKATKSNCDHCGFQVLEITKQPDKNPPKNSKKNSSNKNDPKINKNKKTSYFICPNCYNNPDPSLLPPSLSNSKQLFCWQCVSSTCELAKGASMLPVRPCPSCQSDMVIKYRKDDNAPFLSCSGFLIFFFIILKNFKKILFFLN